MTGVVCSADSVASDAGADILRRGGTAVDAALATNAVLSVTAPHLCGLGGDLFALVHDGAGVTALNASGRAGSGASADRLRAAGHRQMPVVSDLASVTVPGCVDGWVALHDRYGRLPLAELLEPAAELADRGFVASPLLAPHLGDTPLGRDPGGLVVRPGVARTLRSIGLEGRAGFYAGEFGAGLLELGQGLYSPADLEASYADWVEPVSVEAFGHRVHTMPPNSQGYLLLLALGILDGLELPDDVDDASWAHLLVEAAHAAGHDRPALLHEDLVPPLDEIAARRERVGARRHGAAAPGGDGDTTYLCVVDGEGRGVSLIQSNALGFGSRLWEPTTGINLHNRGIGFSLVPGHPAELAPGRRPPHTLAPGLVTRPDGTLRSVVGTMGGDAQPQILLQVVTRLLRHGQDADTAIAAPRWRISGQGNGFDTWEHPDDVVVDVEDGAPWASGLEARGHEVRAAVYGGAFGHAHLIDVREDGTLDAAADPRSVVGSAARG